MLKAIIVDGSAVARGLLATVLTDGGYDVAGQAHTAAALHKDVRVLFGHASSP